MDWLRYFTIARVKEIKEVKWDGGWAKERSKRGLKWLHIHIQKMAAEFQRSVLVASDFNA